MLIKNVNPANNIYLGYCLGGLGLRPRGPRVSGWASRATSAHRSTSPRWTWTWNRAWLGDLSGVHQFHISLLQDLYPICVFIVTWKVVGSPWSTGLSEERPRLEKMCRGCAPSWGKFHVGFFWNAAFEFCKQRSGETLFVQLFMTYMITFIINVLRQYTPILS